MEEENKNLNVEEPTEVLGNTGVIEPVVEEPVTEPVVETPVESPVMEAPVENPVEVEPVAVMAQVETKAEEVPAETVTPMPEPEQAPAPEAQPVVETPAVEPAPAPEAPKKKSKLPLILLLLIVLAAGGFAVWYFVLGGNGSKESKEEENKTAEKSGKDDGKKEESKDKEDKVTVFPLEEGEIKGYESIMKETIDIRREKSSLDVSEIPNQLLLKYNLKRIANSKTVISKDDLKAEIEKNYGDVKYTDEDVLCQVQEIHNEATYFYDSEKGEYTANTNHRGHGGDGVGSFKKFDFFQSAEKNEEKGLITIKYKILFSIHYDDVASAVPIFYRNSSDSYNRTNPIDKTDSVYMDQGDLEKIVNDTYEEYKDELPVTTFTFVKHGEGYAFKSVVTE